jgi:hypothetical protein
VDSHPIDSGDPQRLVDYMLGRHDEREHAQGAAYLRGRHDEAEQMAELQRLAVGIVHAGARRRPRTRAERLTTYEAAAERIAAELDAERTRMVRGLGVAS